MPGLGAGGEEFHAGLEDGSVDAGSERQFTGLELRLQRGESERVGATEPAERRGFAWEAVVDQGDPRVGRCFPQLDGDATRRIVQVRRLEALLAAFLFATCFLFILYDSEARGYGLASFFALASFATARRHLENPTPANAALFWVFPSLGRGRTYSSMLRRFFRGHELGVQPQT